ncbi:FtsW/RodA/SpoVE family cell cycle protein [Bacillus massiliigorillae]|uniref:FtsW/RodA/SpoVE family cell cycle protein n=1 Tax=Bacillus massiliigorillae TaxID=1243664 RepID=UPI0003A8D58E|nr:FtsW/RodA/SpoVE family cell cycle protein [Bacillus massiliigorillae]
MKKRQTFSERFDWTLCLIIFLFLLVSCLAIYSAQATGQYGTTNFVFKQIQWYVIGSVIVAIIMYFDPDQIRRLSWYLYGFGILLLILIIISPESLVPKINGARSWFKLPVGGIAIQPSEFMKTFLILILSRIAISHQQTTEIKTIKTDLVLLGKLGVVTLLPLALIMKQPDLGTSLVIISIFLGIVLVSGINWKILLPAIGGGISIGSLLIYLVLYFPELLQKYLGVESYQFKRIYAWLRPEEYAGKEAFHLEQSLDAIGSGMMTGKGFTKAVVYIPESHSDFIFSVIGEEFGFVGGSIVIGLYFILIYHLIKIALSAADGFISYVCAGIISMLTFHVFQNIGMTIQVLPITGIPLPFISYGGSSLMGTMMAMGVIFSIQYYSRASMFSTPTKTSSSPMKRKRSHTIRG